MGGYEFRRQRPVLDYIADFMCFDLKLVIEVDGITHQWDETTEKDRRKEEALMEAGFTVMRFTDEEVLPSPVQPAILPARSESADIFGKWKLFP